MDSYLTEWLNEKSTSLSIFLNKKFKNLQPDFFIISCLTINAFALMNLITNYYKTFLVFFITAYYCNYLAKVYGEKFNLMDKVKVYYYNLATYVQFVTLYLVFMKFYKYKINIGFYIAIFSILALNSLNYFMKEFKEKNNINEKYNLNIESIKHYTKYFDENMTFVYILVIVTILYYKNNFKKNT